MYKTYPIFILNVLLLFSLFGFSQNDSLMETEYEWIEENSVAQKSEIPFWVRYAADSLAEPEIPEWAKGDSFVVANIRYNEIQTAISIIRNKEAEKAEKKAIIDSISCEAKWYLASSDEAEKTLILAISYYNSKKKSIYLSLPRWHISLHRDTLLYPILLLACNFIDFYSNYRESYKSFSSPYTVEAPTVPKTRPCYSVKELQSQSFFNIHLIVQDTAIIRALLTDFKQLKIVNEISSRNPEIGESNPLTFYEEDNFYLVNPSIRKQYEGETSLSYTQNLYTYPSPPNCISTIQQEAFLKYVFHFQLK